VRLFVAELKIEVQAERATEGAASVGSNRCPRVSAVRMMGTEGD